MIVHVVDFDVPSAAKLNRMPSEAAIVVVPLWVPAAPGIVLVQVMAPVRRFVPAPFVTLNVLVPLLSV